jgi:hypothetical protein
MFRRLSFHLACWLAASGIVSAGCGMTRSTDSARTATEQLLISDAIDQAVESVDFQPLVGQTVYLDDSRLAEVVDRDYLASTLRQHLLASGCTIKDQRGDADFIVEARAGAIGTDRNDLLFGIPATNVPQILPLQGVPTAIPEVPLAKRRDQRGIAKISLFAYHRESGLPVWQSGLSMHESSSNDVWLFGAGPFQYGSIQQSPSRSGKKGEPGGSLKLAQPATFASPTKLAEQYRRLPATEVVQAAPAPTIVVPPTVPAMAQAATNPTTPPRLTKGITKPQLLHNSGAKTAELAPHRGADPMELPQPRFDSL